MSVVIKRIYEEAVKNDGTRVFVDRVWPRGIAKKDAKLDDWLKEIGPSKELRKWFNHEPDKYKEFKQKYKKELKSGNQQEAFEKLNEIIKKSNKKTTLLFGAKEEKYNQAQVLKELVDNE